MPLRTGPAVLVLSATRAASVDTTPPLVQLHNDTPHAFLSAPRRVTSQLHRLQAIWSRDCSSVPIRYYWLCRQSCRRQSELLHSSLLPTRYLVMLSVTSPHSIDLLHLASTRRDVSATSRQILHLGWRGWRALVGARVPIRERYQHSGHLSLAWILAALTAAR